MAGDIVKSIRPILLDPVDVSSGFLSTVWNRDTMVMCPQLQLEDLRHFVCPLYSHCPS